MRRSDCRVCGRLFKAVGQQQLQLPNAETQRTQRTAAEDELFPATSRDSLVKDRSGSF